MSATTLKFIAVFLMTCDHIQKYFTETSIVLSWIGRLAAPIFIFLSGESYRHTHSKKKYMLRLYIASVLMGVINYWSRYHFSAIDNNIFRTLLICVISYYIYDNLRNGKKWILLLFIGWQMITFMIIMTLLVWFNVSEGIAYYVIGPLLGSIVAMEGGVILVIQALIFYIFQDDKKRMSVCFLSYATCHTAIFQLNIFERVYTKLHWILAEPFQQFQECIVYLAFLLCNYSLRNIQRRSIFRDNYFWMEIFALPFILFYNGKRGRNFKYFFYFYYPFHLIVLSVTHFLLC